MNLTAEHLAERLASTLQAGDVSDIPYGTEVIVNTLGLPAFTVMTPDGSLLRVAVSTIFDATKVKQETAPEELTCCDGTGWTGNPRTPCADHYQPSGFDF